MKGLLCAYEGWGINEIFVSDIYRLFMEKMIAMSNVKISAVLCFGMLVLSFQSSELISIVWPSLSCLTPLSFFENTSFVLGLCWVSQLLGQQSQI